MESLLLKVLNFELRRPTGPSSGVVASILLISLGLDCLGVVSLAEVCATCLRGHLWSAGFHSRGGGGHLPPLGS